MKKQKRNEKKNGSGTCWKVPKIKKNRLQRPRSFRKRESWKYLTGRPTWNGRSIACAFPDILPQRATNRVFRRNRRRTERAKKSGPERASVLGRPNSMPALAPAALSGLKRISGLGEKTIVACSLLAERTKCFWKWRFSEKIFCTAQQERRLGFWTEKPGLHYGK